MDKKVLKIKVKEEIIMNANELHSLISDYIKHNYDELYNNGSLNQVFDIEICTNPSEDVNIRHSIIEENKDLVYRMVTSELKLNTNYRKSNRISFDNENIVFLTYKTLGK